MVAGEVAVATLMTSMLRTAGQQVATTVWGRLFRRPSRSARRLVYQQLQARVSAARLRTVLALDLYAIANRAVFVSRAGAELAGVLDHTAGEMTEILRSWLAARDLATGQLADAADDLVLALAGLAGHPDPGWRRPRRSAVARAMSAAAVQRFDTALAEFVRLVDVDTAATRSARNAARQRRTPR